MKIGLAVVTCLASLCLSSCAPSERILGKNMQVVVEGGGQFPAALAGRWQADQDGWQLVIDSNGRISSAVISFGRVEVTPGQITTAPALSGGKATFVPGQWVVNYAPDTRVLTIKIAMDHLHVETGENVIDGRSTDIFIGRVDAGEGLWPVQWTTFSHYTARTTAKPSTEISTDPDKGETKPLIFRKVNATP